MPRKYKPLPAHLKRPDPRFGNKVVARLINQVMAGGKKTTAQRIVYSAMDSLKEKVPEQAPLEVLLQAIENVRPRVETKSRRVGGATYQVPIQVKPSRALALSIKWLLGAARGKKGRPLDHRLADELHLAFKNEGEAVKKREDTHKMAESNRAFAHLAY